MTTGKVVRITNMGQGIYVNNNEFEMPKQGVL